MRHVVFCALAIAAALVQVVLVDGLSLPGGGLPDIALVLVVALGLTQGPAAGMLAGFCAGLCLDVAPPGGYLIGGSALAFCLIGYGCGQFSGRRGGTATRLLAVAVIAVCAGEVAQAGCGLLAGDSGVTLAAARQGLPAAVLYDVLLCVMLLVAAVAVSRSRISQLRASRSRASRSGAIRPPAGVQSFGRPSPSISAAAFSGSPLSGRSFSASEVGQRQVSRRQVGQRQVSRRQVSQPSGRAAGRQVVPFTALARRGAAGRGDPSRSSRPRNGAAAARRATFRPRRVARTRHGPLWPVTGQQASGSFRLGVLPRRLLSGQARMYRWIPRWHGIHRHGTGRALHGGLARPRSGSPR